MHIGHLDVNTGFQFACAERIREPSCSIKHVMQGPVPCSKFHAHEVGRAVLKSFLLN